MQSLNLCNDLTLSSKTVGGLLKRRKSVTALAQLEPFVAVGPQRAMGYTGTGFTIPASICVLYSKCLPPDCPLAMAHNHCLLFLPNSLATGSQFVYNGWETTREKELFPKLWSMEEDKLSVSLQTGEKGRLPKIMSIDRKDKRYTKNETLSFIILQFPGY